MHTWAQSSTLWRRLSGMHAAAPPPLQARLLCLPVPWQSAEMPCWEPRSVLLRSAYVSRVTWPGQAGNSSTAAQPHQLGGHTCAPPSQPALWKALQPPAVLHLPTVLRQLQQRPPLAGRVLDPPPESLGRLQMSTSQCLPSWGDAMHQRQYQICCS